MLTLSDELKIHIDQLNTDIGTSVGYDLYVYDDLIYKGTLYYTGPTDIYIKDIIETYLTDISWFGKVGHTVGGWQAKATLVFSTGDEFESDIIYNRTEIPTVTLTHIPSIVPNNPSDEFFFGWLCPTASTVVSPTNSIDDALTEHSYTTIGHTTVVWNDLGVKTLFRLANQAQKIAVTDEHNSRFYLLWITRNNDYMCRPFCKKSTLNESVSTSYIQTITNRKNPYLKNSTFKWTLNSDWLSYDEHNVYESLLISPVTYLYDNETGKIYRVNVTNVEWIEKNSNNNKKPFNMTVNVEMADENKITY